MKKIRKLCSLIALFTFFFSLIPQFSNEVYAAGLTVADVSTTASAAAKQLTDELAGSGVTISNATFKGKTTAAGIFTGGASTVGFDSGIILSTGSASKVVGTNNGENNIVDNSNGTAGDTSANGVPNLEQISGAGKTHDACILEFDITPANNKLSFQYAFASEEYNQYANSDFNDIFALYVNGVNKALIPGTSIPVSINNINGGNPLGTNPQNTQYYIDNTAHNQLPFTMNGITTVFSVSTDVTAGVPVHIKLAIADVGDSAYDSNVFIKANSISDKAAAPGTLDMLTRHGYNVNINRGDGTDGTVQVTWTAKDSEGTTVGTGTSIFADGQSNNTITVPDSTNTVQLTNPTNGASVAAGDDNPGKDISAITDLDSSTVPDAPTEVTATAGNKSASLTWTAPANDGGSAITGYKIDVYSNGSFVKTVDTGSVSTAATVTGLTNGAKYTFDVKAVNANGDSVPSTATGEITPATVPDAPTGVTVTAGDKSASLAWTAPVSDGGSAITGYKVDVYSDGSLVKTVDTGSASTAATVTGLTNGTKYTFDVKAVNSVGEGAPSAASSEVTPIAPATVPDAPTGVTAAAGNKSASLTWTAPVSDGGSAIIGYKVDVYSNGSLLKTVDADSTSTSTTITGLTNGTKYTFDVKAANSVGDSAPSSATGEVTPATVPDVPTEVTAAAGDKNASLTWTAPVSDGGSAITGYKIDVYSDGSLVKTVDTGSASTAATVTGLTNGTKYTFDVKAVNANGDSVPSTATGEITPATVPDAPTEVTATAGNKSASLTWTAPANDGGSAITGYKVDVYSNGSLVKTVDTGSASTAATITGLTNGTKYTFDVKAANSVGDSAPSSATGEVTPATVPDAPTEVNASAGNKIASLTWTASANDGGSAITGYKVDVYSNGSLVKTVDADSTSTAATVTGLTNGTKYTFDVKAVNANGESVPSAATGEITPATVPDAPTGVTATAGNKSASLTWTAPVNDGGSAITGYKIDVYSNGSLVKTVDTDPTSTAATVTGLTNGTKYTFDVKAVNANGESVPSTATGEITPVAPHENIPTPTSTEPTIVAKVVDEANNSNPVASVNATVKSNADGTETVNVKPSDAIVMKQPEGNSIPFEDYSKIGFGAPSTAPVTINSDGTVQISNLSKDASYSIPVTYDLGGGEKITIGNIHISVDSTGNVNMTSNLIDPYGTLTDSLSGNVISGANVTLYYADTARNKLAGKTPNTIVQLPTINGFKPNNNQNPQTTDSNGAYGYMVYPNTDYYIVVTKDGYDTFTSPSIAVGNDLVKFSAKLNPPVTGIKRVAGNTRVDTAIKLAKSEFTGKVNNIIFATADNYPDALTGSVLAYQQNAPILLVGDSKEDQDKVLAYMKEYLVTNGKVFLLGGTGVVTENFANQVKTTGCSNIIRLGGADRYETAAKIADYLNVAEGTPVVIASGENYPDALSVSSAAAVNQYPILLVAKNVLSNLVKSELAKIKPSKIYIIGGQGAISDTVEKQVAQLTSLDSNNIVRLGGVDRYATAIATANNFKLSGKSACIATGTNFPDALAGSVYAANYNAPIILVGNTLTDEEKAYIKNSKLSGVTIFGGEGAVNDKIENDVTTILSK